MDNIFSKKAWCNPIATRSSTGLATNAESNSSTEADSGCIYGNNKIYFFTFIGLLCSLDSFVLHRTIDIERKKLYNQIVDKTNTPERGARRSKKKEDMKNEWKWIKNCLIFSINL